MNIMIRLFVPDYQNILSESDISKVLTNAEGHIEVKYTN